MRFRFPYVSLFFAPLAWAAAQSKEIQPQEFGLLPGVVTETLQQKRQILRDPEGGQLLEIFYSPLGEIESLEEKTSGGRIIERRTLLLDQIMIDSYTHPPEREFKHRKVSYKPGSSKNRKKIEVNEWSQKDWIHSSYEMQWDTALLECQKHPTQPAAYEKLLSDLSWLQFKPTSSEKRVDLGNHLVSENCEKFPQGGVSGLARAAEQGLRNGLSCLSQLNPSGKMLAAKLLAFFEKKAARKAVIRCGQTGEIVEQGKKIKALTINEDFAAHAFDHDSPHFPGLYLNLDDEELKTDPRFPSSVIFHEMLHWLGYVHGEGIDVAYLAQSCCILDPQFEYEKFAQKEACQLLRDQPQFTSEDYHRRFAKLMKFNFRSAISLEAAWNASQQTAPLNPKQPNRRDLSPLLASILSSAEEDLKIWKTQAKEKGMLLTYLIIGRSALNSLPEKVRLSYQTEFSQKIATLYPPTDFRNPLAESLGNSLDAIRMHDGKGFETAWQNFLKVRPSACNKMSTNEKVQLKSVLSLASVQFFDVKPSIFSHRSEFENPCP